MADMYPIGANLIVKRSEAQEKSAGGILLPDAAQEKPKEGVIIAVGKGQVLSSGRLREPEVKPGDRILFRAYGATEIEIDGEDVLILREDDILAVLD